MGTVLGASGFEVTYDRAGHLDDSALWITDPSPKAMGLARKYLVGSRRKVLVVGRATAEWLRLGAIVVEEGGPLSHAAIIARELGLPAVLNVPGLLDRLSTEDSVRLRVDGSKGTVDILEDGPKSQLEKVMETTA